MITFITDTRPGETPFSDAVFYEDLIVKDLDGKDIVSVPMPADGWTHEKLVLLADELSAVTHMGADAYLGDSWVGSTEV